jgi:hypothetical protein
MTIGDILAVIAAVLLVAASWAATLLMTALLFRTAVARARNRLIQSPGKCIGFGLAATLMAGFAGLALAHHPGPMRLAAYALWSVLALVAAIGSAAVVDLMASRIDGIGTEMAPFARLTRAAALYVGAGFVPIVGWFLVMPIATLATIGAGLVSVRKEPPLRQAPFPAMADKPENSLPFREGVGAGMESPFSGAKWGCGSEVKSLPFAEGAHSEAGR